VLVQSDGTRNRQISKGEEQQRVTEVEITEESNKMVLYQSEQQVIQF
jgi:hypothetical protein